MKKLFLPILCLFVLAQPVSAEIRQGNSSARVDIKTDVEGNGTVTTHIETVVNGKEKTFDSSTSGEFHVLEKNDSNATTSPKQILPVKAIQSAKVNAEKGIGHSVKDFLENIKNMLKNILFKLF